MRLMVTATVTTTRTVRRVRARVSSLHLHITQFVFAAAPGSAVDMWSIDAEDDDDSARRRLISATTGNAHGSVNLEYVSRRDAH